MLRRYSCLPRILLPTVLDANVLPSRVHIHTITIRFSSSSSSSSSPSPPSSSSSSSSFQYHDPNEPVIASYEAMRVTVEAGKTYRWCACGRSASQPWCDTSHLKYKCTIRPVVYTPTKSGIVSLCGCKFSRRRPLCDGAHSFLVKGSGDGGGGASNNGSS
jgi:CDGSH-type Zn-finger protein